MTVEETLDIGVLLVRAVDLLPLAEFANLGRDARGLVEVENRAVKVKPCINCEELRTVSKV